MEKILGHPLDPPLTRNVMLHLLPLPLPVVYCERSELPTVVKGVPVSVCINFRCASIWSHEAREHGGNAQRANVMDPSQFKRQVRE